MKRKNFTLQLAGHPIEVRFVENLAAEHQALGRWSDDERVIELEVDQDDSSLGEVMLHECLHAVSDMYGLDVEEPRIRILALGVHQLLKAYLKPIR